MAPPASSLPCEAASQSEPVAPAPRDTTAVAANQVVETASGETVLTNAGTGSPLLLGASERPVAGRSLHSPVGGCPPRTGNIDQDRISHIAATVLETLRQRGAI